MTGVELTLNISPEKFDEVKKWVNRFFKDIGSVDRFWWAVGAYFAKNEHFPKVNDILWGMLNEDRSAQFSNGDFGMYGATTMSMSNLLHHEGRFKEMLLHACHFTALQCAGAQNGFPKQPFNSSFSMVGSSCIPSIFHAASETGLDYNETKAKFLELSSEVYANFGADNPSKMGQEASAMIADELARFFKENPKPPRFRVKSPRLSD